MIYVVEIPHQRAAFAWTARDEVDFCVKAQGATAALDIYDHSSVQKLMDIAGFDNATQAREEGADWLADLAERYAPTTDLYRVAGGEYTDVASTMIDAYRSHLAAGLHRLLVFASADEARHALSEPMWDMHQGDLARSALKREIGA